MKEEEITQLVNKVSEVGVSLNLDTYILAGLLSLASAGLGAFIGSYLKKKAMITIFSWVLKYQHVRRCVVPYLPTISSGIF
jgi:hypothetical protein